MRMCPSCRAPHDAADWRCAACGYAPRIDGAIPVLAPHLAQGSGEDADYLHQALADAETAHFWFVARTRLIAQAIRRYFPDAASMLDVGCGTGGVAEGLRTALPSVHVLAADVRLDGLQIAKRLRPDVDFVQLDVRDLPFDANFDVVGAFDVIEHLDDDAAVLGHLYKAVKPNGGILITVPQHAWLWSPIDDFSRHRRRYSRRLLVERITGAGFRVEAVTSFMTFLLPAIALSRLNSRPVSELDPDRELRISPWMNAAFSRVCDLERAAIRMGVSFPAGGSLLAVARRVH